MRTSVLLILAACLLSRSLLADTPPQDPLNSIQWPTMYRLYLADHGAVFDERIQVLAPAEAEDSMEVPVLVDATGLDGVEEMLVFADFNPLPKVLRFHPVEARALLGFRIKVQQATAIRAAVRRGDGPWHVGQAWVEASGGGCTLPSLGSADPAWESRLGQVRARLWPLADRGQRLRFEVIHPMDTGLAAGIPVFHLESVRIAGDEGRLLARIEPFEPVSENPLFTLETAYTGNLTIDGLDNNGNRFSAGVAR